MGRIQKLINFFNIYDSEDDESDKSDNSSSESDDYSEDQEDIMMTETAIMYTLLMIIEAWFGGKRRS